MEQPNPVTGDPVEMACAFVTVQSTWLRRALVAAPGDHIRQVALAVHDRGLERWLGLLANIADPRCAAELEALYLLHGRVVEVLSRPVPAGDAEAVGRILADRVATRTREALDRLRSAGGELRR